MEPDEEHSAVEPEARQSDLQQGSLSSAPSSSTGTTLEASTHGIACSGKGAQGSEGPAAAGKGHITCRGNAEEAAGPLPAELSELWAMHREATALSEDMKTARLTGGSTVQGGARFTDSDIT